LPLQVFSCPIMTNHPASQTEADRLWALKDVAVMHRAMIGQTKSHQDIVKNLKGSGQQKMVMAYKQQQQQRQEESLVEAKQTPNACEMAMDDSIISDSDIDNEFDDDYDDDASCSTRHGGDEFEAGDDYEQELLMAALHPTHSKSTNNNRSTSTNNIKHNHDHQAECSMTTETASMSSREDELSSSSNFRLNSSSSNNHNSCLLDGSKKSLLSLDHLIGDTGAADAAEDDAELAVAIASSKKKKRSVCKTTTSSNTTAEEQQLTSTLARRRISANSKKGSIRSERTFGSAGTASTNRSSRSGRRSAFAENSCSMGSSSRRSNRGRRSTDSSTPSVAAVVAEAVAPTTPRRSRLQDRSRSLGKSSVASLSQDSNGTTEGSSTPGSTMSSDGTPGSKMELRRVTRDPTRGRRGRRANNTTGRDILMRNLQIFDDLEDQQQQDNTDDEDDCVFDADFGDAFGDAFGGMGCTSERFTSSTMAPAGSSSSNNKKSDVWQQRRLGLAKSKSQTAQTTGSTSKESIQAATAALLAPKTSTAPSTKASLMRSQSVDGPSTTASAVSRNVPSLQRSHTVTPLAQRRSRRRTSVGAM